MSAEKISEQTIFQPVVVKTITDNKTLVKELMRSTVIGLIAGNCLPLGVEDRELMLKKVQGVTLSEVWEKLNESQKDGVMVKLAELLLAIKERYEVEGKSLIASSGVEMSWDEFLLANEQFLVRQGDSLNISLKQLGGLKKIVRQSREIKSGMTLVHGDLGLSNVLLNGIKLQLIDFEHTVEGPIELELAVANFWSDENSLPVEVVVTALEKLGQPINKERLAEMTSVYLVNQLRLADEVGDGVKSEELIIRGEERGIL